FPTRRSSDLATLAKALNDRPGLKLDIIGRADPATDAEGLRQAWVDLQIRKAKAADTGSRGKHPDPATVEVSAAERAEYLEEVYNDTDIDNKPRNFIGFAKSVPANQMEALLREAAPIYDDDLRKLADARAQAVYEKLQETGPADRIFIVASSLDGAAGEGDATPSRVDFALKEARAARAARRLFFPRLGQAVGDFGDALLHFVVANVALVLEAAQHAGAAVHPRLAHVHHHFFAFAAALPEQGVVAVDAVAELVGVAPQVGARRGLVPRQVGRRGAAGLRGAVGGAGGDD